MKNNMQKLLVRAAILLVLVLGSALTIFAMDGAHAGFESASISAAVQQDVPVFSIQIEDLTATGASCATIKPYAVTPTAGGAPSAPDYICADANNGRPVFSWRNDPNAEWYNLWFGVLGDNFYQAHYEWYSVEPNTFNLPQASCEGLTCTVQPKIELLQGGEFQVWMQAWGNGSFSDGGSGASIGAPAWNGPQYFSVPTTQPGPAAMTATVLTGTGSGEGNLVLRWAQTEGSTWYNVWVGTGSPDWAPSYFGWVDSVTLGCYDDGICELTPGTTGFDYMLNPLSFNPVLASGSYVSYIQSWGHGQFNSGGLEGTSWVQGAGDPIVVP